MWRGSRAWRHERYSRELYLRCKTALLLVPERAKQRMCLTESLAVDPVFSISFSSVQMFEGTYSPPFYLDLYNFKDGAQDDIFLDSYSSIPPPSPTQREVPTPINHTIPTQSPASTRRRDLVPRTAEEPGVFASLFNSLFSIKAKYTREAF